MSSNNPSKQDQNVNPPSYLGTDAREHSLNLEGDEDDPIIDDEDQEQVKEIERSNSFSAHVRCKIMMSMFLINELHPWHTAGLVDVFPSLKLLSRLKVKIKQKFPQCKKGENSDAEQCRLTVAYNCIKGQVGCGKEPTQLKKQEAVLASQKKTIHYSFNNLKTFLTSDYPYQGTCPNVDIGTMDRALRRRESFKRKHESKEQMHKFVFSGKDSIFSDFGFGILSFFNLLYLLVIIYFVAALFSIPMMRLNAKKEGIQEFLVKDRIWLRTSLGNFGFKQPQCRFQYLEDGSQFSKMKCQRGQISSLQAYGVIPQSVMGDESLVHMSNYCGEASKFTKVSECMKALRSEALEADFLHLCEGRQNCEMNFATYIDDVGSSQECSNKLSKVYIQYYCEFSEEQVRTNNKDVLAHVGCVQAIVCVYIILLLYFRRVQSLEYKEWNLHTVTVSNYSIEIKVTDQMWENFKKELRQDPNLQRQYEIGTNEEGDLQMHRLALVFKLRLMDELERELSIYKCSNQDNFKVADVHFSHSNTSVLKLLTARGRYLTRSNRFARALLKRVDRDLDEIQAGQEEKYIRPCSAFVTFQTAGGHDKAMRYMASTQNRCGIRSPNENHEVFGVNPIVRQAPEPSNIIWENYRISDAHSQVRRVLTYFLIVAFFFVIFLGFAALKIKSNLYYEYFPIYTDCEDMEASFKKNDVTDWNRWKEEALVDKYPTMHKAGSGFYQCYCTLQNPMIFQWLQVYLNFSKEDPCFFYAEKSFWRYLSNFEISVAITMFDYVLRITNAFFMRHIGLKTQSQEVGELISITFVTQFCNLALLIWITHTGLRSIPGFNALLGDIAGGDLSLHSDLDMGWYMETGSVLIDTLLINIFTPQIDFILNYTLKWIARRNDKGWTSLFMETRRQTKSRTIQEFVQTYSGPEFEIYSKYAFMLKWVAISFMYGLAFPIVFPLTFLALLNLYIMDKVMVVYFYKAPPQYDAGLVERALFFLTKLHILFLLFGYWIAGNPLIFKMGECKVIDTLYENVQPYHPVLKFWENPLPAQVLVYLVFVFIFGRSVYKWVFFSRPYRKYKSILAKIDEMKSKLHPYFETLQGIDQMRLFSRAVHLKEHLGVQKYEEKNLDLLQKSKRIAKNYLVGCPNYDIISNERYASGFQFVPMELRQFNDEYVFNDRKAYKLKQKAKESPSENFMAAHKKEMEITPNIQSQKTISSNPESSSKSPAGSNEVGSNEIEEESFFIDQNDLILRALSLGQYLSEDEQHRYRFLSHSSSVYNKAQERFAFNEKELTKKFNMVQVLRQQTLVDPATVAQQRQTMYNLSQQRRSQISGQEKENDDVFILKKTESMREPLRNTFM